MRRLKYGLKKLIKMFFVDANIFLEIALGDERKEECKEILSRVQKNLLNAITSDFIMYTCLLQIESRLKSVEKMQNFLTFLDNMEGMQINSPNNETIYDAFEIMKKYKLDFDDSLVVAIMKSLGLEKLISFDKHFDKVREIKRLEPVQFLKGYPPK